MDDSMEAELKGVLGIRKLRVDSLRRKQMLKSLECKHAENQIQAAELRLEQLKVQMLDVERSALQELTASHSVKVDRLVNFTKLQQQGVKAAKDGLQHIEDAHQDHEKAQLEYAQSTVDVNQAEKKLMGIEQLLEDKPWL